MNLKQLAAEAAIEFIQNDVVLGLGTGSTAECFLAALGIAIQAGRVKNIRGVPTSIACRKQAEKLGIPLVSLKDHPQLDMAVDGADEVDPHLNLIKGLGGALLREKMVESAARQMIVIADYSKEVPVLGSKCPLPVEVVQFSHEAHLPFFRSLGATAELRINADGSPFVTDNGNLIYHLKFARIDKPEQLQAQLKQRPGVVETGLFVKIATMAILAGPAGVKIHRR